MKKAAKIRPREKRRHLRVKPRGKQAKVISPGTSLASAVIGRPDVSKAIAAKASLPRPLQKAKTRTRSSRKAKIRNQAPTPGTRATAVAAEGAEDRTDAPRRIPANRLHLKSHEKVIADVAFGHLPV